MIWPQLILNKAVIFALKFSTTRKLLKKIFFKVYDLVPSEWEKVAFYYFITRLKHSNWSVAKLVLAQHSNAEISDVLLESKSTQ